MLVVALGTRCTRSDLEGWTGWSIPSRCTRLELGDSKLADGAARSLAKQLLQSDEVEYVDVTSNFIRDAGISALEHASTQQHFQLDIANQKAASSLVYRAGNGGLGGSLVGGATGAATAGLALGVVVGGPAVWGGMGIAAAWSAATTAAAGAAGMGAMYGAGAGAAVGAVAGGTMAHTVEEAREKGATWGAAAGVMAGGGVAYAGYQSIVAAQVKLPPELERLELVQVQTRTQM